jgi:hypothetical protein
MCSHPTTLPSFSPFLHSSYVKKRKWWAMTAAGNPTIDIPSVKTAINIYIYRCTYKKEYRGRLYYGWLILFFCISRSVLNPMNIKEEKKKRKAKLWKSNQSCLLFLVKHRWIYFYKISNKRLSSYIRWLIHTDELVTWFFFRTRTHTHKK